MKKILLLGSTGSIGVNALRVIADNPDMFKPVVLTANSNIDVLEQQIKQFSPQIVVVRNPAKAKELRTRITNGTTVLEGEEGLLEVTQSADYDILLSSLVGFAGLKPTINAIKRSKRIALANKETLVAAGEYVMALAKQYKSEILPVDSEHSAIFQCLVGEKQKEIEKIILTASGGPFLNNTLEDLQSVSVEDALNHPNWKMGTKITIDSSTMMNKGLEVIEAKWLFDVPVSKIDVIIHPQSVIHSMVEFVDNSIKAQLSLPDMKIPIQYAFTYPDRTNAEYVKTDFRKLGELAFVEPDMQKFRCLSLAFQSLEQGGVHSCILNAANEIAVDSFLKGKIKYLDIANVADAALNNFECKTNVELETIFEFDTLTRKFAANYITQEF